MGPYKERMRHHEEVTLNELKALATQMTWKCALLGIPVIRDILASSGGVTVSYYEWVQNRNSEHWDSEEVQRRLLHMIRRAYQRTMFYATEKRVDPRIAAYSLALESLAP
ncbi:MAG: hypothetical protein HKN10_08475 [Myxococcales bacterium]|nr:hypothetical protein [Myxococcales bacterium]